MLPQIFAVLGTYVLEQICFCVWEDLNAVEWRNLFPLMELYVLHCDDWMAI